jgi:class 3 adenylate cyclase
MAQRMESVARQGEVMLSASTERLVHGSAVLAGFEGHMAWAEAMP